MKRKSSLQMKYVQYAGEVGCGRPVEAFDNVFPFIPKSELTPVALPEGMPAGDTIIYTVRGPSLTDFNIFDDDRLLVLKKFSLRNIRPDTVCIVFIHSTGELVAKRIDRTANKIILKASGGGVKDAEYAPEEIEIRGVVLDVLVNIDAQIARAREAKRRQSAIGRRNAPTI